MALETENEWLPGQWALEDYSHHEESGRVRQQAWTCNIIRGSSNNRSSKMRLMTPLRWRRKPVGNTMSIAMVKDPILKGLCRVYASESRRGAREEKKVEQETAMSRMRDTKGGLWVAGGGKRS